MSENVDVLVLGAGIVGVSTALVLQEKGLQTLLVDRRKPGLGASFGNSGVIQREAISPYAVPRDMTTILRTLLGRNTAARIHWPDFPALAPFLIRYWWHSAPGRHARCTKPYESLIRHCLEAYARLTALAGNDDALSSGGIYIGFRDGAKFRRATKEAQATFDQYGVRFEALAGREAYEQTLPHLRASYAGVMHYPDSLNSRDPHALLVGFVEAFTKRGGRVVEGDALTLRHEGDHFVLPGIGRAPKVVNALGAHGARFARRFGQTIPLGFKRGYHVHLAPDEEKPLARTFVDETYAFVMTPKARGIRLTSGAEFALPHSLPTPVQIEKLVPLARSVHPLGRRLDETPWMGCRPCMPDMLPVIGPSRRQAGLFHAFGHGHQGLTLGPVTGEIICAMITGRDPVVDVQPFSRTGSEI